MTSLKAASSALILAGALVLAGCGTAPWDQPQFAKTHSTHTPGAVSAPSTPTPTPPVAVHNDLAAGSARHVLQAGDIRLTVSYWSTLPLSSWRSSADKPISLSATATSTTNPSLPIYLSSATLRVTVDRPHGALHQLAPQVDRATTVPGDDIGAPYSYGQDFVIPAVDADATGLTLLFTYALLEQTTPTSKQYSKQSAIDTITVPLAGR